MAIASKDIKPGSVVKRFSREVRKHSGVLTIALIATVGMEVAELSSPLYLRTLFNTLVRSVPSASVVHGLYITLAVLAALYISGWCMSRLQIHCINILDSRIMSDLYASAFEYLINHSYNFFSSQFTGTLTRKVSKYAGAFETLFDAVLMQFAPTFLFIVGAVCVLFFHNHTLGLALGIWVVLFVWLQVSLARWRQPLRDARAAQDSRLTGNLADSISNQSTIALFSGTKFEYQRLVEAIANWRKATLRSWIGDEYIWSLLSFLMIGINVLLLFGAVYFWQRALLTIGDFVLIQAYLLTTFQQLIGINRTLRRFYDALADASEMVAILDTPHSVQDLPSAISLTVTGAAIDFRQVYFQFHADSNVLHDFNLHIRGTEKLALVGPSGAGKSTVTKLLLRFFDVSAGSIEIDGTNIADVNQDSLRDAIAFVPQEAVLFHRTLMENIRYGRRDATDEEVIEAAKKAHCHEFISGFPEGYSTFVGERGVKLSGGERQRVAIARAILKNAPILVLDEATSSLDSESESLIQDALKVLMQGKTVVVIAHRLSTIMNMDRIVVLEGGKIEAEGTHAQLLKEDGLYQKLWNIQAGGFLGGADIDADADKDAVD